MNSVEIQPWEVLESSTVFSCPWLKVRKDICRSNRGNVVDYYVIDRFSYVLIVAVTPHSEVLVVRQYKHGAKQVVRELPAGYIEPGEDPVDCARRELREETGYEAERIEPLAVLFASPTAASNKAHIFLATGLVKAGDQQPDPNEKIVVEKMDLAAAVAAQPFQGLSSVAALLLAWQRWASAETTRCPSNPDSCSPSRQEKTCPDGPVFRNNSFVTLIRHTRRHHGTRNRKRIPVGSQASTQCPAEAGAVQDRLYGRLRLFRG